MHVIFVSSCYSTDIVSTDFIKQIARLHIPVYLVSYRRPWYQLFSAFLQRQFFLLIPDFNFNALWLMDSVLKMLEKQQK